MAEGHRIVAIAGCCVIAAATPFIAGTPTAILGLVLLAYAIWLIVRADWAFPTRLVVSALAVVATGGLTTCLLILAALSSGD